jgi:hypothetical protein
MMRSVLRGSVALLLLLAVACSGSDSKDAASEKSTTTTSTTTTTIKTLKGDEVDAKASPYCAAWADIRELGGPTLTGDSDKDTAERKVHYAKLVPLAEKLVVAADDDIKADAQYALDQVREVARTGSDEAFLKPDASKKQQELAQYALDHCAKQ